MPLLDLFLTLMWFFLFVAWVWLVDSVIVDVFRSDDLFGWAKALWAPLVIAIVARRVRLPHRAGELDGRARPELGVR